MESFKLLGIEFRKGREIKDVEVVVLSPVQYRMFYHFLYRMLKDSGIAFYKEESSK